MVGRPGATCAAAQKFRAPADTRSNQNCGSPAGSESGVHRQVAAPFASRRHHFLIRLLRPLRTKPRGCRAESLQPAVARRLLRHFSDRSNVGRKQQLRCSQLSLLVPCGRQLSDQRSLESVPPPSDLEPMGVLCTRLACPIPLHLQIFCRSPVLWEHRGRHMLTSVPAERQ